MKSKLSLLVLLFSIVSIFSLSSSVFASGNYVVYKPWQTINENIEKQKVGERFLSSTDRNNDGTLDYLYQNIFDMINRQTQIREVITYDGETNTVIGQYTEQRMMNLYNGTIYEDYWVDGYYTQTYRQVITPTHTFYTTMVAEVRDVNGNGIPDQRIITKYFQHEIIRNITDVYKVENKLSKYSHSYEQTNERDVLLSTQERWEIR